jgi:hypothetical protein
LEQHHNLFIKQINLIEDQVQLDFLQVEVEVEEIVLTLLYLVKEDQVEVVMEPTIQLLQDKMQQITQAEEVVERLVVGVQYLKMVIQVDQE